MLQIRASDASVAGLSEELGRRLRLAGVSWMMWDTDFEEWCTPARLSDMGTGVTRIRLTGGAGSLLPVGGRRPDNESDANIVEQETLTDGIDRADLSRSIMIS